MKRQGKVDKMTYFDEELDQDLLAHLAPFYEAKRGNNELLHLARIGLALLRGASGQKELVVPITTLPASQNKEGGAKHEDHGAIRDVSMETGQGRVVKASPRRHDEGDPEAALAKAQRAAQSDFKFGV